MGRGISFTLSEDDFIITNAEIKTAQELFELHQEIRQDMLWPERTLKSLARRLERLREMDEVGKRTEEAKRKASIALRKCYDGELFEVENP